MNSISSQPIVAPDIVNNKTEHANRTFEKWSGLLTKKIISKRLGISYDVSIKAMPHRKTSYSSNKILLPMYGKEYTNYQENFSTSHSTKLRQLSRLNRFKNRIFCTNTKSPATSSNSKKSSMFKHHSLL